jgi:aminobenzoyl-glutamate utilization protein B
MRPLAPIPAILSLLVLVRSTQAQDWRPSQQAALADVDARAEELKAVNKGIWQHAEVGLQERRSSALLIEKLESAGFEVKRGVSGMPTAFVATFGSGRPIIGILAEYDALPGLSQKTTPQREPAIEGGAGHACGHSGLGTGALGAALAVKAAMEKHKLQGTLRLYGTPAEETVIGKVYMALDGQFSDLDVCLHWHPATKNEAWAGSSKALVSAKFTFSGTATHASVSPQSGRRERGHDRLLDRGEGDALRRQDAGRYGAGPFGRAGIGRGGQGRLEGADEGQEVLQLHPGGAEGAAEDPIALTVARRDSTRRAT